jgi:ribonucleoside-diphosphate reductase alpha chain
MYGKRNITNNTIAPVGTGSIVTGTTSGIEPLFAPFYKRKRRGSEGESEWIEYLVVHKPLLDWAADNMLKFDKNSEEDLLRIYNQSPYAGMSAREINPIEKIEVQAIWQKHIDNSISVTYNVPAETSVESIRGYIELAWIKGLKGFTVYREGSRDAILSTEKTVEKEVLQERPTEVPCEVFCVKINGETWTVIMGLINEKPYEIFALKVNDIIIKDGLKGKLRKTAPGKYDFISEAVDIYDLASKYTTGNEQVLTRLLSRELRKGTNINEIVDDFMKVNATIGTFENVLLRVLHRFTTDAKDENGFVRCISCANE